jgi:hypothetical protein
MMSFTKSRFNHKIDYELTRYANKRFCRVIGGAGKLLNYFIIQWKPESIITYADMRYSQGNLYIKLGFNFDGITEPNYGYVIDGKIQSRQKYQKHKLEKKLEFFDSNLTEEQNMKLHDYYRIYDCGNMTFKMTI